MRSPILFLYLLFSCLSQVSAQAWQAAKAPLVTRWARNVSPATAHREYPRPQLERAYWRNLNGLWDWALAPRSAA